VVPKLDMSAEVNMVKQTLVKVRNALAQAARADGDEIAAAYYDGFYDAMIDLLNQAPRVHT
jgi:hypothetical protein